MLLSIYIGVFVLVVGLDQLSKFLIVKYDVDAVVIPNLLKFIKSYNTGAAFSFLSDKKWAMVVFIIMTIIVVLGMLAFMIYRFYKKKPLSKWLSIALVLIMGGAIGNFIDRVAMQKVRDFIFVFYNTSIFPAIFNVADIAIVVGVIMILIDLLFLNEEAIFKSKKKVENGKEDNQDN